MNDNELMLLNLSLFLIPYSLTKSLSPTTLESKKGREAITKELVLNIF